MELSDEDAQMLQMMGFASFGNKPKHGKNRDRATKAPGTSSNLTPLGNRMTTNDDPDAKATRPSQISQPEDMSFEEQQSGQEDPEWVAARLPNLGTDAAERKDSEGLPAPINHILPPRPPPVKVPSQPHQSTNTSQPLNVKAHPFQPSSTSQPGDSASDTTIQPDSAPTYTANDVRSEPKYWTSLADKSNWDNAIGYTSPWTGAEITRKELKEYAVGKRVVQPNGEVEVVFFKPSFVVDDPWEGMVGREEGDRGGR